MCAISENRYGKGSALYVAVEPNRDITTFLLDVFSKRFNIEKALELPDGVKGRKIAQHQQISRFLFRSLRRELEFCLGKKLKKNFVCNRMMEN